MERREILLLLKDIGYKPRRFRLEITPEEMDYSGEYAVVGNADVLITVVRTDIGYHMKVEGEVDVRFVCSRCLEEYVRKFRFSDENILRRGAYSGGVSLKDEDVDSIYIDRDEIDVLPIIREIFISNLPINPVCSPDCKGICPVCGLKIEDEAEHRHEKVSGARKLGDFLQVALKEGGKK
ncbi:MAG: DUF177 domain-containing protein [Thermotogae bacterium]|nr:DUF177 domain-containing protein [Thermotogota bacterium]